MEILWCSLDRESETPLYEQLYSHIKKRKLSVARLYMEQNCLQNESFLII